MINEITGIIGVIGATGAFLTSAALCKIIMMM